ncbi:radical SAM protein [Thermococcus sp.]
MVYISLLRPLRLHEYKGKYYFVEPYYQNDYYFGDSIFKEIILRISKEKLTFDQICEEISNDMGVPQEDVAKTILEMHNLGIITFSDTYENKSVEIYPFSMCTRALLTLTHRCNFQCKHCLQGNNKWSPQIKELTTKEWMNMIDQLSEYGASYLFFTGGEPFLRRDTLQLLQYAGEYAFPLRVYTNATLLTPEIIKNLSKIDNLIVQVSLHGISEQDVDPFVGVLGAYKKIITSIKTLTDNGVNVAVASSLRGHLIGRMEDFVDLLLDLNVSMWIPTLIMPVGCGFINWKEFRPTTQEIREFLENLLRLMSIYNKENSGFRITGSFNIELLQDNKEFENFSFQCVPYIAYINIEPDGTITPCDRMTEWKLGSLKEKSLKELLSDSRDIRRDWKDIYGKLKSLSILQKCKSCKYYALCGGVCPGIAFRSYELGEEYPDPIVCRVFNEAMDIILKYSSLPVKRKILELIKG